MASSGAASASVPSCTLKLAGKPVKTILEVDDDRSDGRPVVFTATSSGGEAEARGLAPSPRGEAGAQVLAPPPSPPIESPPSPGIQTWDCTYCQTKDNTPGERCSNVKCQLEQRVGAVAHKKRRGQRPERFNDAAAEEDLPAMPRPRAMKKERDEGRDRHEASTSSQAQAPGASRLNTEHRESRETGPRSRSTSPEPRKSPKLEWKLATKRNMLSR